jgi:hypothetical protein
VSYNAYLGVSGGFGFLLMALRKITHRASPHELHPMYISDADEQDTHSVAPSFIYKSLYLYPKTDLSIKSSLSKVIRQTSDFCKQEEKNCRRILGCFLDCWMLAKHNAQQSSRLAREAEWTRAELRVYRSKVTVRPIKPRFLTRTSTTNSTRLALSYALQSTTNSR